MYQLIHLKTFIWLINIQVELKNKKLKFIKISINLICMCKSVRLYSVCIVASLIYHSVKIRNVCDSCSIYIWHSNSWLIMVWWKWSIQDFICYCGHPSWRRWNFLTYLHLLGCCVKHNQKFTSGTVRTTSHLWTEI